MKPDSLFTVLESIARKPSPFSAYTASDLWTDEHISARMLEFHLDGDIDISSRRTDFIDKSALWMREHFALCKTSRIIDFGCGPGLYTSRFAKFGAEVCGVDFSSRSIAYAREQMAKTNDQIAYIEADYLQYEPEGSYDLITMIMCDFCALAPEQRSAMLAKFKRLLSATGRAVLDVYSLTAFESKQEGVEFGKDMMNGFWSPDPYIGFVTSFRYDEDKVSLDKYTIVERNRVREVYNWLQYFCPSSLEREIRAAGLTVEAVFGDVAGQPYDAGATEFAVVLKAA